MRTIFFQKITIVLFLLSFVISRSRAETVEILNFGSNPGNLVMKLYKPLGLSKDAKAPVLIAFHGCSQSAGELAALTGWDKLADKGGFYVIYPEQKLSNNPGSCFNWFMQADYKAGSGENESVMQMLHYVKQNYQTDSNRVFLYGFSAGASLAQALAVSHPSSFQSVALFAGTPYGLANSLLQSLELMAGKMKVSHADLMKAANDLPKNFQKLPSVLIFQGLEDMVVHPDNALYLRDQWFSMHQTKTNPDYQETNYLGNPDITKSQYFNASNETVISVYLIKKLNHRILISPGDAVKQGGATGLFGEKSNFHSTYEVALCFKLIGQQQ
jgi:poly(hydroxyalkanoate) depolymerase family esterase